MKSARFFRFNHLLQGVAAVSIGGLFIAAGFVLGGEVRPFAAPAQTAAEAGGVERYLIHVSTDKPIYRSGERLYVRGVLLRADGHTPITTALSETDRKSTRLNSSHSQISYAVFCLKKKKKK